MPPVRPNTTSSSLVGYDHVTLFLVTGTLLRVGAESRCNREIGTELSVTRTGKAQPISASPLAGTARDRLGHSLLSGTEARGSNSARAPAGGPGRGRDANIRFI